MPLSIKYRPTTFNEVVGNRQTISELKALTAKDDPPHAYLLTGPTGCGKTTLANIIAHTLGCQNLDYIQYDAAFLGGVQNIRKLRYNSRYMAWSGKRRCFLLDEAHQLTPAAQNILLKLLEEPPEHCYFVLCTTDTTKLLDTIVGRCSVHSVSPLTEKETVHLLARITNAERATLDRATLVTIAKTSGGHPRNALHILETVLAVDPQERSAVVAALKQPRTIGASLAGVLLAKRPWPVVTAVLAGISETDVRKVRDNVVAFATNILKDRAKVAEHEIATAILTQFLELKHSNGVAGLTLACRMVVRHGYDT